MTTTIDCDANPYVLNDWKVEEHIKGGQLRWNPDKVELYLCDEQKGGVIQGNKLRKLLKGKKVLNACVLDYLLADSQLIPNEWKNMAVFFWGTIYLDSDGNPCVRCLIGNGDSWVWGYSLVDDEKLEWGSFPADNLFNDKCPAALACK